MSHKPPLRAVAMDETAPAKPKSLIDAAELGERDLLATMRRKVAAEIDGGVPAHALAPLLRQLRDIDKEIRQIDQKAEQEAEENAANAERRRTWNPEAI